MSIRPEPLKRCKNCGAGCDDPYRTSCPLCDSGVLEWVDLAAGLEHRALLTAGYDANTTKLLRDAANLIRTFRDTIESMQQAQGGAKRRRQEEKARRLAEVIEDDWGFRPTAELIEQIRPSEWVRFNALVNEWHPHDPQRLPSDETKAKVAAMFAEPQEAGR